MSGNKNYIQITPDVNTLEGELPPLLTATPGSGLALNNGMLYVDDASNVPVTPTGATVARTLAARLSDVWSIEDFGVVHDPSGAHVTANTAAYQAALDAAAGVARLRHRAGMTVIINAKLNPPDKTAWEHDGVLMLAAQSATVVSAVNPWSDGFISGRGIIDGNATNQTGSGTSGCIDGDSVSNFVAEGITCQNAKNWPFNVTRGTACYAVSCSFLNGGNSVEFAENSTDCWFMRCVVDNIADLGIGHYGGAIGGGTVDCRVSNCSSSGIFAFCDNSQSAAPIGVKITGNNVTLCGSGIQATSNVTNGATYPINTLISDNYCYSNKGEAIYIGTAQHTVVKANRTYQNNTASTGTFGEINIASSASFTKISDNMILNPGGGSVAGYGIYANIATECHITGNMIVDSRATKNMQGAITGTLANASWTNDNFWGASIGVADTVAYQSGSAQGTNYDFANSSPSSRRTNSGVYQTNTAFQASTAGSPFTIPDNTGRLFLDTPTNPGSYTITMPANPQANDEIDIVSQAGVTTLTLQANTGQSFDATPPTSLSAGIGIRYLWSASFTQWLRIG